MTSPALEQALGRPPSPAEAAAALAALERARAAHPQLLADARAFFGQLAPALQGAEDVAAALGELNAGDVLLAALCAAQDPAALALFERRHLGRVALLVRRLDDTGKLGDEVTQALREKLFFSGPGARARILDFTGKGSLDAWLRAAAVRTALNLRRARGELWGFEPDAELADHVDLRPDPELALARAASKGAFAEVFGAALADLPPRDRAVLKLHYLDGLTTQQIAVIYGTHRITVTRWLVACRHRLLEATRRGLVSRFKLDALELESLLRAAKASFDISLKQHLGGAR